MSGLIAAAALAALQPGCGDGRGEVTQTGTGNTAGSTNNGGSGATASGGGGSAGQGGDTIVGGGGSGGTAGSAGAGGGGGCVQGLKSIALSPDNSTVMLDGNAAAPITFTATGTLDSGKTMPLPGASLSWTATRADDTPPGDIKDGVLMPNPNAGGAVTITATDGCVKGSTNVNFVLDVAVGQPADPGPWMGMPVSNGAPDIVYPSDQTRFPRNLYRTIFQWHKNGMSKFRLTFEGPNSTVTVYTDGVHGLCANANPPAGCWEVNEVAWSFIAGSNAGQTATWTVDGLDESTNPPTVRRGKSIEIGFSKQDVKGAIFYWSTTSAGVRRGRISQQNPEDYVVGKPGTVYGNDQVACVACHVVSRDGKYLAAPVQSKQTQSLWVFEVTKDPPPNPLVTQVANTGGHGFATISPDDANMVAAWKGKMWQVDRATGNYVKDLPTAKLMGTHPDWSPTGKEVVFATGNGDAPSGSSLAKIAYNNGTWENPAVFLAPPAGKSNLFPMFSPNADFIAFSQGKGGHGDDTAQLFVIDSAGAKAPIELIAANRVTNNQTTLGQYQNSQPTWAPPGDYHWIAFNTKRAYGVIRPQGTQQIWVAAIDPSKAAQGMDPSYPAFRVPFQGLDENNHRAFWTLDIADGGGGSGGAGGSGGGGMGGAGGGMGGAGGGTTTTTTGCGQIIGSGQMCDPLQDCCETGSYCDTKDNGMTYICVTPG
jgi:hypothetical protein